MSIKRTLTLLNDHLKTIEGLPPLQVENTRQDKPKSFVRATLNPAQSNVLTLGYNGLREMQGLYSVDVYGSQDYGPDAMHDAADAIVAAFPVGLSLTDGVVTVRIKVASVMTAQAFDKYYGVPVSIQWSAFTQSQ